MAKCSCLAQAFGPLIKLEESRSRFAPPQGCQGTCIQWLASMIGRLNETTPFKIWVGGMKALRSRCHSLEKRAPGPG